MLLMLVLMAQVLSSCSLIDEPDYAPEPVDASLAFSVSSSMGATTRMANEVVQDQTNGRSYRGLGTVYLIPFAVSGEQITSSDHPSRLLQDAVLMTASDKTGDYGGFYLYNVFTLVRGINAFLVYAKAGNAGKAANSTLSPPSGVSDKAYFGSLQLPDLTYPDLAQIRFRPDPIYTETNPPAKAQLLAEYLTDIAEATGNGISWSNSTDATLKGYFLNFTGQENGINLVMAGSSLNVAKHVQSLYDQMSTLTYDEGSDEKDLVADILDRIKNYKAEYNPESFTVEGKLTALEASVYPASLGLPDGAAALQWAEIEKNNVKKYEFVPQTQTTTTASINTITRYCYPPELFYYANSRINTSNEAVNESDYTGATDWSALLASKYKNQNAMVTGNTQAIAVQQPLQYAVGRLKMSMQAETTTGNLKDAADKDVTLTDTSFPLTGVIICNQHPVGFDFKPVLNEGAASHAEDGFIYDTQVGTNYLTTTETNIPSTLVLQSYDTGEGENNADAEEVTIALEFRNNSGQNFKGKGGVIYDGTKFYLIGKIKREDISQESQLSTDIPDDVKTRVFTRDYITIVSTKVQSLANAYNVLPDLLGGRLELGVELTTKWIQAETTNVILE